MAKHGGSRPNSGRKPRAVTGKISEVNRLNHDQIAPYMPKLLRNLKKLADGGFKVTAELFEVDGETGEPRLKRRTAATAPPDRAANEYLINRLLGKPVARHELGGPDGGPIPVAFERALDLFYGSPEDVEAAGPGEAG